MLMYPIKEYYKPVTYSDMATVESVNAGEPYYVSGPDSKSVEHQVPVAGSVSCHSWINENTGEIDKSHETKSMWVTCTKSRFKYNNKPFKRHSLKDDGVIHQTYSSRLAFTNIFAALYYAETGRTK